MADNAALGLAVLALGKKGQKGDKGDPGVSVTVGTTTTGAAGSQASVTNSGTASDPVLNFTIPQGATGQQGPAGQDGEDGSIVTVSASGSSTDEVSYITIDDVEYKLAGGSGGSEPAAYLKSADVADNTLTLTKKDNTTVVYTPNIPTKTSDLTNDSGFLTEHQSLAAYRTSAEQDVIDNALDDRVDAIEAKEDDWDAKSVVSGTNDGTNWSTITINGTTKNIPNGGQGGEPAAYIKNAEVEGRVLTLTKKDNTTVTFTDTGSLVSGTNDGTNWTAITIDGTTKSIPAGGAGTSYTFTSGLTNTSGTVKWDLNDRIKAGTGASAVTIGGSSGGTHAATGAYAVAMGDSIQAWGYAQTVVGKFNEPDEHYSYAFIVGNGADKNHRTNALTVDWNGNIVAGNFPAYASADANKVLTINASGTGTSWVLPSGGNAAWGSISGTLADQTDLMSALNSKQATIVDLADIRSGAALGSTAVQPAAISDMATMSWVSSQGYLTSHQSLQGYATEAWVGSQGYLTEHQSLSNYYTKSEVDAAIAAAIGSAIGGNY